MTLLRWLSAVLALPTALAAGWLVSQLIVGYADARCAPESRIGGACVAAWHTDWVAGAVYAGVAVAALLVSVSVFLLVPRFKAPATVVALLLGVAAPVALYVATGWADLLPPLGFALALGLAFLMFLSRRRTHA